MCGFCKLENKKDQKQAPIETSKLVVFGPLQQRGIVRALAALLFAIDKAVYKQPADTM